MGQSEFQKDASAKASESSNTKITLRLGPEAIATLKWIQERRGVSTLTEVFRRAIATERFLLEREDNDEDIILENKKTGKQRILHLR